MADEIEKDDLRGDIANAMAELAGEPQEKSVSVEQAPVEQPAEQPVGERARDEHGRFAKAPEEGKPRETLTLKEKAPKEGPSVASPPPAAPQAGPSAAAAPKPDAPPPIDWKGEAKINWPHLPKPIRDTLSATWEGLQAERAAVAPYRELIDSHKDLLVRESGSVENGMRELFAFARLSVDNAPALIQHIARARNIDLRQLVGQPAQQQGPQDGQQPDIASLLKQAVQAQLQPLLDQQAQQTNQQISQTVDAFRADPKHPYFEDVRVHMGHLLRAGVAKDMQDAYDQATWANPTIRAQLQSSAAEEAKNTQAAEAERARKAAAASLRGSPLPGAAANGSGNQNSTVHDDVRAAMAELAGA